MEAATTLFNYVPVLIQLAIAIGIPAVIIIVSHIFGQRSRGNYAKDKPYECGLISEGTQQPRFGVKFYVVAMLFILFDIEVVFLIPWVITFRDMMADGIAVFWPMIFFLVVLTVGLIYEMKKKGIEWERQSTGASL